MRRKGEEVEERETEKQRERENLCSIHGDQRKRGVGKEERERREGEGKAMFDYR
jgi:hypothetical protein